MFQLERQKKKRENKNVSTKYSKYLNLKWFFALNAILWTNRKIFTNCNF